LIFSAQSHGLRHGVRYLEIEINNHLLRTDDQARGVAERLANPILALVAEERRVTPTMEGKCGSF
jgi:predicted N-formylglutamate amidohydrolase